MRRDWFEATICVLIPEPVDTGVHKPLPLFGKAGLYLSPGGPYEANHVLQCRALFGGLKARNELAVVNLHPHEQNYAKKCLRHLGILRCDSITLKVTPVKKLEN